jgi:hypothetical protein
MGFGVTESGEAQRYVPPNVVSVGGGGGSPLTPTAAFPAETVNVPSGGVIPAGVYIIMSPDQNLGIGGIPGVAGTWQTGGQWLQWQNGDQVWAGVLLVSDGTQTSNIACQLLRLSFT